MRKSNFIELADDIQIPILYEDRAVLAIDKPYGWMLIPHAWDKTDRNLQLALISSIHAGDFWAHSRGLRYLRFVHRLDGDTTGVLLLAKTPGALKTYSELLASRSMEKVYLAVAYGVPTSSKWSCHLKLGPDLRQIGRIKVDARHGKEAETHFQVLQTRDNLTLIEARLTTGRTHQIRVHLSAAGHPIFGDPLYGPGAPLIPSLAAAPERPIPIQRAHTQSKRSASGESQFGASLKGAIRGREAADSQPQLALRAVLLAYRDPFQKRFVRIEAPAAEFKKRFGFDAQTKA